ncbi:hypothetical protein ABZ093_09390 [Streptomyces cyaneofuscatus]
MTPRPIARRPAAPTAPFAELVRIESDPAYRALIRHSDHGRAA